MERLSALAAAPPTEGLWGVSACAAAAWQVSVRGAFACVALLVSGCGAGRYGYSRTYTPLAEERAAAQNAETYDPVMAQRQPGQWQKRTASVFGVVASTSPSKEGHTVLELSVRKLRPRNLCDKNVESSCRTTVSDLETARLRAHVRLRADEEPAVTEGSLVRVIGRLRAGAAGAGAGEKSAEAWLDAVYYRHWPRLEYVTDAARDYMRR